MTRRFARRLPFRIVQRLGQRVDTVVGSTRISVPVWDSAALAWIYWRPGWLTDILRAVLRWRPATFLDVGANVGQSLAAFLSADVPSRYIGFEPNPRCAAFLQDLIQATDLRHVDVVPAGLWREASIAVLNLNGPSDPTASLRADLRPDLLHRQQWVATVALDLISSTLDIGDVSCIKLDVEGAELEALEGMAQLLDQSQPVVICEVLRRDPAADAAMYKPRVDALRDFVREHQFKILRCELSESGALLAFKPVDEFPLAPWSPASAGQCDYVFVPHSFPPDVLHAATMVRPRSAVTS